MEEIMLHANPQRPHRTTTRRRKPRRGMAVVMVLGLLAITFALSYAMMRTQVTTLQIQRNTQRAGNARRAALTGLSMAIEAMHRGDWQGIQLPLSQSLSSSESYQVTFTLGDPRLSPTDADYAEFPYRVTITSTGTATDPGNAAQSSTYQARAIVQLVRRAMTDEPANWSSLQPYSVYQWSGDFGQQAEVDLPVHIEGDVKLQNRLLFCPTYPGDGDDEPFDGTIDEVALFNRALSAAEIQEIYTSSNAQALVGSYTVAAPTYWWRLNESAGSSWIMENNTGAAGTVQGSQVGVAGPAVATNNLAASFDGWNDHINLGCRDIGGTAMTILAWFKADDFNVERGRIVSKATGSLEGDAYWVLSTYFTNGVNRLRFRLKTSGWTESLIATSGNLVAGEWVFAAAVYDGTKMYLYRNGILVGSTPKFGNINTNSQVPVYLGDTQSGSAAARVLRELRSWNYPDMGDMRPFTGTVSLSESLTGAETVSLLRDDAGTTVQNITTSPGAPVGHPGSVVNYRLYPGGPIYSIPHVADYLQNQSLEPNVLTNPLGIYRHSGTVQLGNNVSIKGTMLAPSATGGIRVVGRNVRWEPVDLPALSDGSAQSDGSALSDASPVSQLPIAIVANDLVYTEHASATVQGLVMTWDNFEVENRASDFSLSFQGKVVAADLELHGHKSWDYSTSWWGNRLLEFAPTTAGGNASGSFLMWLASNYSIPLAPSISISPDLAAPAYHWHNWNQTIFVKHSSDAGLRWQILDWKEANSL